MYRNFGGLTEGLTLFRGLDLMKLTKGKGHQNGSPLFYFLTLKSLGEGLGVSKKPPPPP